MSALEPILVSVNDAAQMIAVGRVTLYKLIGEGKIKAVKQASRTLIPVQSLKDFAASLPEMQPTLPL